MGRLETTLRQKNSHTQRFLYWVRIFRSHCWRGASGRIRVRCQQTITGEKTWWINYYKLPEGICSCREKKKDNSMFKSTCTVLAVEYFYFSFTSYYRWGQFFRHGEYNIIVIIAINILTINILILLFILYLFVIVLYIYSPSRALPPLDLLLLSLLLWPLLLNLSKRWVHWSLL